MSEGQAEGAIKIRRVTNVHADFDEGAPGQSGRFYFQFILDDGAEEHIMRPTVDDGRLIMQMISASETLYFDTERERLMLRQLD